MQIRNPVVAGSFYPLSGGELRRMIKDFLDRVEGEERDVIGLVSPHAGYLYCGKVAASVYKIVKESFNTVVILGPNHSGSGTGIATLNGIWRTPIGSVKTDEKFVKEITKDSIIMEDFRAHAIEHSIEVQIPWLQYRFRNFQIVPISINPIYFDEKTCKEIGIKIAEVSRKLNRKILIVASSDFTHYGSMYGYTPFEGTTSVILKKIKEMDAEIIKLIERLRPEDMIRNCHEKNLSICGYGCIGVMLFAVKELGAKNGELIEYSTSFDISRNINAIVGYAGIAIY
jgi:hypothetical protein